jgi:hypothetical protein
VVAVSTNLLAVSLSTLLIEQPTTAYFPISATASFLPKFNGNPIRATNILNAQLYDHFYVALANLTSNTLLPPWLDHNNFYLPFSLDVTQNLERLGRMGMVQNYQGATTGFGTDVDCTALELGAEINGFQFYTNQSGTSAQLSTYHRLPNGTAVTCILIDPAGTGETASFLSGNVAMETMLTMRPGGDLDDGDFCENLLLAAWLRAESTTTNDPKTGVGLSSNLALSGSTFIACTAKPRIAEFQGLIDPTGYIMDANQTADFSGDSEAYFSGNMTQLGLISQAIGMIAQSEVELNSWHNDSITSDWMNSLMVVAQSSHNLVDPAYPAPPPEDVIPLLESIYRTLFASLLALNTHVFPENQIQNGVKAGTAVLVTRIFLSPAMFKLAAAILSLHVIIAILYYVDRPKMFLPRMPTSIGAIVSYFPASRAVEDFSESPGKEKGNPGGEGEQRYAYGRYIGIDGKTHIGIERHQNVVPLESKNPEVKKRRWAWHHLSDEREPRTWI